MKQAMKAERAAAMITDGASIVIGGFIGAGSPHRIIDALLRRKASGLAIIVNDAYRPDYGRRLIAP